MTAVDTTSLRVLCAEDNRFLREAITTIFESAGHRVHAAADGHQAWDILLAEMDRIDVVVTDHQMPGFSGLELVQLLRQTVFRGRIYVYSSRLQPAEEEAYRQQRVDGVFAKTIALDELRQTVESGRPSAP